jgi:hypothetical protein
MKKASFKFPDYRSLWLFKEKTTAINVRIRPSENMITGLFNPAEIEMAEKEYKAEQRPGSILETNPA